MTERTQEPGDTGDERPVGLWLVGARGAVATTCTVGLDALASGRREPVGLVSALPPFAPLRLVDPGRLVVGGWEVRPGTLLEAARDLERHGVLPRDVVTHATEAIAEADGRIAPGAARPDDGSASTAARARGALPVRERVETLVADLAAFRTATGAERVVVVNLASTEAAPAPTPAAQDLAAFEAALDAGDELPASCLYAYAALRARCAHVNFTPSTGASWPALRELAREVGVPHCGNDGKTGETLVKTALAPMFAHRNLRVLTWQGYNLLGNRDGEVLAEPAHKRAKVENKDAALRSILGGDPSLHTHVGIDFVPSLHDWKTAWDFVHFEGFLGARMSLQFTWSGSDSALAAPLVIDLVRFCDLALRDRVAGELTHLAPFFKSPLGGGTHDFHAQSAALFAWAAEHARAAGAATSRGPA